MAATLLDALKAYWSSAGLDTSVGPVYGQHAQVSRNPPYARMFQVGGKRDYTTGTGHVAYPTIQISVFAPDESVDALAGLVTAAMDAITDDRSLVTFSGGRLFGWFGVEPKTMLDPSTDKLGRQTTHIVIEYHAKVNRDRA